MMFWNILLRMIKRNDGLATERPLSPADCYLDPGMLVHGDDRVQTRARAILTKRRDLARNTFGTDPFGLNGVKIDGTEITEPVSDDE